MAAQSSNILFDDIFTISVIETKKFDRVSRLTAHSKNYGMNLTLDYNIELFPLKSDQSFAMALASSLSRGDSKDDDEEDKNQDVWRPGKDRKGLDDDYEYVMFGKVYKFDGANSSENVTVYASFGGLLMALSGPFRHMTNIVLGDPIYILLRK